MNSNYAHIEAYVKSSYKKSPTWFISKIFGLCYLEKSTRWQLLFGILHRISLIILYLASIIIGHYTNEILNSHDLKIITKIGNCMHLYGGFAIMMSSYWHAWTKIGTTNKLFHLLSHIDSDIQKIFGSSAQINQMKRKIYQFELVMVTVSSILLIGSAIYDFIVFWGYVGNILFIYCYAYIGPHFVAAITMTQFIYMVKLVQLRFSLLNQILQHMLANCETITVTSMEYGDPFKNRPNANDTTSKSTIFIVNGLFQYQINAPPKIKSTSTEFETVNHNNLRMTFELHNRLMDVAELINKCYERVLLVSVIDIFTLSIFGLFFETKVLFWSWEKSMKLILISTSPVLWVIAGLTNVYVLLSVCENARSAAYEAPLIVHKIIQKKPLFMLQDDNFYNKMKAFTIQVLHRKKTFNFSAFGLFNFDYTFIFSAVSAATSFLIVLLQFDVKFE